MRRRNKKIVRYDERKQACVSRVGLNEEEIGLNCRRMEEKAERCHVRVRRGMGGG